MRLRMALLAALILVGCSRGVQPQGPAQTAPVHLTPESSGVRAQLRLAEAVAGGQVWLDLQGIPVGAIHLWRVGLTDGQGANYLFGMLTDEKDRTYRVPTTMAPGAASLWISAGEEAPGPGTIRLPLTLLPKYEEYRSDAFGIRFTVPEGWRLQESTDIIILQRTWERASTPVEEIVITRCPGDSCLPADGKRTESKRWVGQKRVSEWLIERATKNQTAFWTEQHLMLKGVDIALEYRQPLQNGASGVYDELIRSLNFLNEPPPVDRVTLCTPVLSGVHPAIGADWVRASDGPCWVEWHQASSGLQVQLSWSEAESESWVYKLRTVPIEGGRYQGQLGQQMMEKTGGAFWGPNAWALEVTGERGRVTVTCGMQMAPDREQGRARQVQVDGSCPDLLSRTVVGDLGKPVP